MSLMSPFWASKKGSHEFEHELKHELGKHEF